MTLTDSYVGLEGTITVKAVGVANETVVLTAPKYTVLLDAILLIQNYPLEETYKCSYGNCRRNSKAHEKLAATKILTHLIEPTLFSDTFTALVVRTQSLSLRYMSFSR